MDNGKIANITRKKIEITQPIDAEPLEHSIDNAPRIDLRLEFE